MRRILILAFSDLRHDARIARQVNFLQQAYALTVVCFDAPDLPGVTLLRIHKPRLTWWRKGIAGVALLLRWHALGHRLLYHYSNVRENLRQQQFHLVIANDVESLPLAFDFAPAKVMFDAHEYAPRHFEDKRVWRIFFQRMNLFLCRTYIPRVASMTTVGAGLAREYEKNFGVKPIIITNAARLAQLVPSATDENRIRLVHHGGANPSRKLELMIDMMELLDDRFTIDLMLITPQIANAHTRHYLDFLYARAAKNPRIKILPPLPSAQLVPFLNQYDIGVFLLPPINFNYANTLPNKLFDFIQARLAVAIGPTPEMADLVTRYQLGIVSTDFTPQSLATALQRLSRQQIDMFKQRAHEAAREVNAEKNQRLLLAEVSRLLAVWA